MSILLNLLIGFVTTGVLTLAIIWAFNAFTVGGVAALGKEPLGKTISGT